MVSDIVLPGPAGDPDCTFWGGILLPWMGRCGHLHALSCVFWEGTGPPLKYILKDFFLFSFSSFSSGRDLPHRVTEADHWAARVRVWPHHDHRAHPGATHAAGGQAGALLPEHLSPLGCPHPDMHPPTIQHMVASCFSPSTSACCRPPEQGGLLAAYVRLLLCAPSCCLCAALPVFLCRTYTNGGGGGRSMRISPCGLRHAIPLCPCFL